ncbi:diaminopimelate epimerase [bacterium]|nr:diaminopimelate epimerase [bacterium]
MKFTKMHGLGNDFIILDSIKPDNYDLNSLAIKLCDRHTGIGADGIVLVLPSDIADIQMRIINSDGSEPNMCGNAIRCFSKYVFENQIITKSKFTIETLAGLIKPEIIQENNKVVSVKVNMGIPELERVNIPMMGKEGRVINEKLTIGNTTFNITSMLMNVPHTIVYVDDINAVDVNKIGSIIEKHKSFPKGTNVNFVQVINSKEIKVRTWERGAGATIACGTGCCASAVASILNNKTEDKIIVHLALGYLEIEWTENVYMTGPAELVFKSEISIN